jgi:hypothetical protein
VDHDEFGSEHDANTGDARNLMGADESSPFRTRFFFFSQNKTRQSFSHRASYSVQ